MGLCPSRNSKASAKGAQTFTPLDSTPTTPTQHSLRADAQAFVPKAQEKKPEKEAWETFLEQKQQEHRTPKGQTFARKVDGTFTQDYRKLLGGDAKKPPGLSQKYVPPQQREGGQDWIAEWKQTKAKPAPRKPPGLTKEPQPVLDSDGKLKQALLKVKQQALPRDQALEQLAQLDRKHPKDDADAPSALVPFGLTDAHYLSDKDDEADSHRHCASIRIKPRSYVAKPPTPAVEESMTRVLHCLRQLRSAEQQSGLEEAGRRYCVGIREVARMLKDKQHCGLKAVLVAPDVEADGKTVKGSLDDRLNDLIRASTAMGIPVIYGLSRQRLGQAIKKSVTISVMGILSVRGMQEPFEQMLRDAA